MPVNFVSNVDLPTEGNPIKPTRVSPDLDTSKPRSPAPPPFLPADAVSTSSRFSLEIFANLYQMHAWYVAIKNSKQKQQMARISLPFNKPKCPSVALFFCVLAYSVSNSLIFNRILSSPDDIISYSSLLRCRSNQ